MPALRPESPQPGRRPPWRSRWWTPGLCLLLGIVLLVAFAIGGDAADGVRSLAVMAALALLFALGGRSETLSGLGGPDRDERWASIDLRATAFAGSVVLAAIVGTWLYEAANGRDASVYVRLAALGALAYLAAIAWSRRRW